MPTETTAIRSWHAHVYYDPAATRDLAAELREQVAARFPAALLGRWHDVKVGPIEFAVKERQTVAVPVWAGVGAIAIGAALLAFGGRR